jgi:hypothetical protein
MLETTILLCCGRQWGPILHCPVEAGVAEGLYLLSFLSKIQRGVRSTQGRVTLRGTVI